MPNEELSKLFIKQGYYFEGLQFGNFIVIVKTNYITDEKFRAIFLHEYLHRAGLYHIPKQFKALMNEYSDNFWVSKYDIEKLS